MCLVALLATGAQQSPASNDMVVIVDANSPIANGEVASRLRERALADFQRGRHVIYFELTSGSITPVPESAAESFRQTSFTLTPPKYSGVSLSFNEAVEILRGNESVRDSVIRRECRASTLRSCGAGVPAAAKRLVADMEGASGRKLKHLIGVARPKKGANVILVTAGWPHRDERGLGLDDAARELQAAGVRLVVLRVPAFVVYTDLVRDASESLASRLSPGFVAVNDEQDAERARRALAEHYPARATAAVPPVESPVTSSVESPVSPEALPAPSVDVPRFSGLTDDVLRRAASYVARFERTFAAVIWRERYQQENRTRRRFNASGATFSSVAARRLLDSELLFVWLPREASWIAVRDVIAIDGKPRPATDRRLATLLSSRAVSVDQLKELAAENGRFNIGQIVRTFNEPTLALLFLDEHYRHRFTFARSREQASIDGRNTTAYDFVERASPTVIRDGERDVPVRGMIWIEAATGSVLRTLVELSDGSARLSGRMTVRYGSHARFDVLVPLEMRETYTSGSGEEITAVATYSEFRRFETAGRLIL